MPSQNTTQKERDRIGMIVYALYAAFLIAAVVVVVRIAYIQWFWTPDAAVVRFFRPASTKSVIDPDRGAIIARDGRLLALSTPMYQLYMDCTVRKTYFADRDKSGKLETEWLDKARQFAKGLSAVMRDKSAEAYYSQIAQGRKTGEKYLKIGVPVDRETLLKLKQLPLMKEGQYRSGVIVTRKDSRNYPYGTLARRTIGYVKDNSNSNGNNHIGLEGKYDYVLHGQEGEIWLKPTDNREKIQNYDSTYVKPKDGLDVRTTLDITIQGIADKALRKQIQDEKRVEMACAIIMDVETGAIRAMVNLMRDSTDWSLDETYNMAIGYSQAPGSVFKATTLMTAIEDGYVKSLDDRIPTNNGHIPGYPDDEHVRGMKDISILHGFEISSNYVFRYLAVHNYSDNPKKFMDKLYMYKLGQAFDFDLEGLREPYLPVPGGKGWSKTALGSVGMGYSIEETPLHILTFYNAIANKGKMMKPYLVEGIEKNGKVTRKQGPSVLNGSICSRATADTLLRAMKAVTSEGTATRLKGAKVQVAGKTGTSRPSLTPEERKKYGQSPTDGTKTRDGSHHNLGTFVGFFPADNPKYSAIICAKTYLIRGSLYGGVLPAAAMREIVDQIYALDPTWGKEYMRKGSVPDMEPAQAAPVLTGAKAAGAPDVKGLGLRDAMFRIEKAGLRCAYSGTGHVRAQNPKAGVKVAKGGTVTLTLE